MHCCVRQVCVRQITTCCSYLRLETKIDNVLESKRLLPYTKFLVYSVQVSGPAFMVIFLNVFAVSFEIPLSHVTNLVQYQLANMIESLNSI